MMSVRSIVSGTVRKLHQFLAHTNVLVLGDSHIDVFSNRKFIKAFPRVYFNVVSVGGATASGLENPRAKTQAFQTFDKALKEKHYDKIIVMLGEVDTGFVIWYRAQKYNADVEDMFHQAVKNYERFLTKVVKYGEVIVISTPLPTIDDNTTGEVAHARREIVTTQEERTLLTLEFNKAIENFCEHSGILYINLDVESLGKNGIVHDCLKNKDPKDHHYDFNQYAKLIIRHLKRRF